MDSPTSVDRASDAAAVFPFSVLKASTSIRISPRTVLNTSVRDASVNRTFPPEIRIASTENTLSLSPFAPAPFSPGEAALVPLSVLTIFFFFLRY